MANETAEIITQTPVSSRPIELRCGAFQAGLDRGTDFPSGYRLNLVSIALKRTLWIVEDSGGGGGGGVALKVGWGVGGKGAGTAAGGVATARPSYATVLVGCATICIEIHVLLEFSTEVAPCGGGLRTTQRSVLHLLTHTDSSDVLGAEGLALLSPLALASDLTPVASQFSLPTSSSYVIALSAYPTSCSSFHSYLTLLEKPSTDT